MADLVTFNGVPIVTYGLTGIMIVLLTGMTFIDTKGDSANAIATASVPSFIGNILTPPASASSLMGSTPSLMESITGPAEKPSFMESITGSPEKPSFIESITISPEKPSFIESITGKSPAVENVTTPIAKFIGYADDKDEDTTKNQYGGSKKRRKLKKKKRKNTRKFT